MQHESPDLPPDDFLTRNYFTRSNLGHSQLGEIYLATADMAHESASRAIILQLGDIALDAARAAPSEDDAVQWVDIATGHFEEIIGEIGQSEARLTDTSNQTAHLLVRAYLQKALMPNWRRAVQGLAPVENAYETFLGGVKTALPFAELTPEARGELIGAMPLLMALRAHRVGRLALRKEGFPNDSEPTKNWRVGIAETPTALQFLYPSLKLEVRTQQIRSAQAYIAGGVATVTAKGAGFTKLDEVIHACSAELQQTNTPAETAKLDAVTAFITERIRVLSQYATFQMDPSA